MGQALSDYSPVQCRRRSRARASLRNRHHGPSIMGFENEAERSIGRPCRRSDGRSKRTYDLTSWCRRNKFSASSRLRDLNRSTASIPSACRITNIVRKHDSASGCESQLDGICGVDREINENFMPNVTPITSTFAADSVDFYSSRLFAFERNVLPR